MNLFPENPVIVMAHGIRHTLPSRDDGFLSLEELTAPVTASGAFSNTLFEDVPEASPDEVIAARCGLKPKERSKKCKPTGERDVAASLECAERAENCEREKLGEASGKEQGARGEEVERKKNKDRSARRKLRNDKEEKTPKAIERQRRKNLRKRERRRKEMIKSKMRGAAAEGTVPIGEGEAADNKQKLARSKHENREAGGLTKVKKSRVVGLTRVEEMGQMKLHSGEEEKEAKKTTIKKRKKQKTDAEATPGVTSCDDDGHSTEAGNLEKGGVDVMGKPTERQKGGDDMIAKKPAADGVGKGRQHGKKKGKGDPGHDDMIAKPAADDVGKGRHHGKKKGKGDPGHDDTIAKKPAADGVGKGRQHGKKKGKGDPGHGCPKREEVDVTAWTKYQLHPTILRAISKLGFKTPTPIQERCIPAALLQGKDVIGAAETGSGKTLAFGIPIIQRLIDQDAKVKQKRGESCEEEKEEEEEEEEAQVKQKDGTTGNGPGGNPCGTRTAAGSTCNGSLKALILTPTRELALQVCDHISAISQFTSIRVVPIVGGMATQKQQRLLSKRPAIVIATPGRLWELMSLGETHLIQLDHLSFFVLDEADRMVQRGHFQELQSIIDLLPKRPALYGRGKRLSKKDLKERKEAAKQMKLAAKEDVVSDAGSSGESSQEEDREEDEQDKSGGDGGDRTVGGEEMGDVKSKAIRLPTRDDEDNAGSGKGVEVVTDEEEDEHGLSEDNADDQGSDEGNGNGEEDVMEEGKEFAVMHGDRLDDEDDRQPVANAQKRQTMVFSATLTLPAAMKKLSWKGTRAAAAQGNSVSTLVRRAGISRKSAVIDLTSEMVVARNLQEGMIECVDTDKDTVLYYLLRMHPVRTLIFCTAISAVRRVSALLKILELPIWPLHAQMQQQQRLKPTGLPSFPIKQSYMPGVQARISLALKIDAISHKSSQEKAQKTWMERNAKAMDIVLESDGNSSDGNDGGRRSPNEKLKPSKKSSLQLKALQKVRV
ncbi:hypothetical protein CBR_g11163 [Chara braunii]|uniref:ATP-dependent RNA helicase n=1 Tax=Chara braunii TaxID=69332 RepID=A0A388KQ86_CHABU|nr:hypothetical protein CBR_g11163 [Chara braunii]|eukprot:GBG72231.1 hypothetical protein CBR_g11163 [Chara braunii]